MDAILLLLLYIVYVWFFPVEKVRRVQCAAVNEGRQVVCVCSCLSLLFFFLYSIEPLHINFVIWGKSSRWWSDERGASYNYKLCAITYTWDGVVVTNAFREETVADFPSENRRAFAFVVGNFGDDARSGYSRLRAANGPRFNRSGLVIPFHTFFNKFKFKF